MTEKKILAITFVVLCVCWGAVFILVFLSALPDHPITIRKKHVLELKTLIPEGWGFFTRNPREQQIDVLVKSAGGWISCLSNPNSNARNLFGIRRTARSMGLEYSFLLENIAAEHWQASSMGEVTHEMYDRLIPIRIENKMPGSQLCGEMLVIAQEVVPWAWSTSRHKIKMPLKYTKLSVTCNL